MAKHVCPVCGQSALISTVTRSQLPAMQNYVYRRINDAVNAKNGRFDLRLCPDCGFAHNGCFDSALLDYDGGYDNDVPSAVMLSYYKELAAYLYKKNALDDGLVVDVGCGNGTFVKILCQLFPTVRALGIDPSYDGVPEAADGRITFVADVFSQKHVRERPSLVICRHVLEHIPDPVAFLRSIHASLRCFKDVPLFFEVPDANWIIENNAFWDFCYEHCNYFTSDSLARALELAQFTPGIAQSAYGDQYLWIEAGMSKQTPPFSNSSQRTLPVVEKFHRYVETELSLISGIRQQLQQLKNDGRSIAIWGMATKGVVFSFLVDRDKTLIDFCIDVNENKQRCFVPLTGHAIQAPDALAATARRSLVVVVMNLNYLSEIKQTCNQLALAPMFVDANGNQV